MKFKAAALAAVGAVGLFAGCSSEPKAVETVVYGSCEYTNPFSDTLECKRYLGADWAKGAASSDCELAVFGAPGVFDEQGDCAYDAVLGTCAIGTGAGAAELVFPGSDVSTCADIKRGCEVFAQGVFTPGESCEGVVVGGGGDGDAFVQPYLVCKDPIAGEPPGQSENGQVCTWTLISASTEENRRFDAYASCPDVLTQRPYYASPPAGATPPNDPRLMDSAYMAEVEWARKQVESSACICCHSTDLAPDGPSQWFVEADGIWLDSISDSGIGMMAGLADSTAFGAFDPSENNGFDRTVLGVPTTNNQRMEALLKGEWERRGLTNEDAANLPAFGGPLASQLDYVPTACATGQGIKADGTVEWVGGDARYLYILDEGAANPGVPPNLDEPQGTRWLVDVPSAKKPFASGISFGQVSGDLRQRIPEGNVTPLTKGQTYYLYVLQDVGIPITRCLFVAP